ncbi:uncharacterized protein G2W53_001782 [Senna tora]|uniref:Uncharacterized protein n=1 Tax=Senna tora TaxID=362788 RepID=A0A835CMV2_9FABA|nr:uncharacterized protein G2W53_001782 [Senna tora]
MVKNQDHYNQYQQRKTPNDEIGFTTPIMAAIAKEPCQLSVAPKMQPARATPRVHMETMSRAKRFPISENMSAKVKPEKIGQGIQVSSENLSPDSCETQIETSVHFGFANHCLQIGNVNMQNWASFIPNT